MKKLFGTIAASTIGFMASTALAADEVASTAGAITDKCSYAIAAGIAIGIAAMGGAIGQGKVAASAMEGIARNPEAAGKVMTPMIISLALIESLVIYALVIAFLLEGKI